VSLIHIDPADLSKVPLDIMVYGRNGVHATPIDASQRELGIIVETAARTPEAAILLARLLAHRLGHDGYPGHRAAAGNIAYPLSPDFISFARKDGRFGAIVAGGSREPAFIDSYPRIKAEIVRSLSEEFPDALADADFTITDADASNPVMLLRTVDRDPDRLAARHRQEIRGIMQLATPKATSRLNLDAPDAYDWSLYHLLQNEQVIQHEMFPIAYYRADGKEWIAQGGDRAHYFEIGDTDYRGNLDERTLSAISDHAPSEPSIGAQRLRDMAAVIRSKDAGVNRVTFDIIFASGENYEAALYSNAFSKDNVASVLKLPPQRVIGTFFVDACNTIKISIDRPSISASIDDRDVFGTQQQAAIETMDIPIYPSALAKASAF
jgi:hypothetical protein